MTSLPLTSRHYAYFRITGPGTHAEITALLGFKPSQAWDVGDISPVSGRAREFMSWSMGSGLDDTHPLVEHVGTLLMFLSTKAESLRTLWVDFDLTLQCVGYFPHGGHGVHFTREQVRQAARLGIALDLDFYDVDNHGHER